MSPSARRAQGALEVLGNPSTGAGGLMNLGTAQAARARERLRDRSLAERFGALEWSFPDSAPDAVNDVHPYPAKFISAIPAQALSLVDVPGAIIDPFCGSGTTLVEAVRSGRNAVGIDLNPIAALVTRAKLSGWSSDDTEVLQIHRDRLSRAARKGDVTLAAEATATIPRLDHWFDAVARHALAGATAYLRTIGRSDPWRDRVGAAISSVVVRVSRQESDTRYAAIEKKQDIGTIATALARALDRVAYSASQLAAQVPKGVQAEVLTGDAATILRTRDSASAAAAIFSPPYPNAYEYWLYHKYRMYWLGFDPVEVRSQEIGARPFYSGSGRLTEDDFARQLGSVVDELARVIVAGGMCLIVVGDSIIRGRFVNNASVVRDVAGQSGLEHVGSTHREIRRTRRSFNLAVARAAREHVLLFTKP